jgi:hypothetical protein
MLSASGLSAPVAHPNFNAAPLATSGPVYYTPSQVRTAYGIDQAKLPDGTAATGAGQTIAIVDAYHDPNIKTDLATFDSHTGLAAPPSFKQVQLNGVTQVDAGWSGETSLDVEWAHAVAPQANLLLVEAPSANFSDLLNAVSYAASQPGVVAVSMSWGGNEFYGENSYDSTFRTPSGHVGGSGLAGGVTFVASSGDSGAWFGPEYPSISPNVLAVGGSTLNLNSNNTYKSESGWSLSGGGYSGVEAEPSYQQSAQYSGARTGPDVAYDADPNTGFLVRDTVGLQKGQSGWWVAGGTSAGAPQWAGILALSDQARAQNGLGSLGGAQASVYALPHADFHQITTGFNGYSANPAYDSYYGIVSGSGYNFVTGLGTPLVNKVVHDLATASNPFTGAAGGKGGGSGGGSGGGHDLANPLPGDPGAGNTPGSSSSTPSVAPTTPTHTVTVTLTRSATQTTPSAVATTLTVSTVPLPVPTTAVSAAVFGSTSATGFPATSPSTSGFATLGSTGYNPGSFLGLPTSVGLSSGGGESVSEDLARQMFPATFDPGVPIDALGGDAPDDDAGGWEDASE